MYVGLDKGKPMGDKRDLPEPRKYEEGWVIGKPDVIFDLPEERTIPANGVVPYQYYRTPTNFKEDVWVTAAEGRPGNRGVVHHIVVDGVSLRVLAEDLRDGTVAPAPTSYRQWATTLQGLSFVDDLGAVSLAAQGRGEGLTFQLREKK